jgi:hypothetical protein
VSDPTTELGAWTLPPLIDAEPSTQVVGRREERLARFLARDGIRKALLQGDERRRREARDADEGSIDEHE